MGNDWTGLTKEAKEHGGPEGLRSHYTNAGALGDAAAFAPASLVQSLKATIGLPSLMAVAAARRRTFTSPKRFKRQADRGDPGIVEQVVDAFLDPRDRLVSPAYTMCDRKIAIAIDK